jgi:hypothetical protein
LRDFEREVLRVVFWYNARKPERIDEMLDAPNEVVWVA